MHQKPISVRSLLLDNYNQILYEKQFESLQIIFIKSRPHNKIIEQITFVPVQASIMCNRQNSMLITFSSACDY